MTVQPGFPALLIAMTLTSCGPGAEHAGGAADDTEATVAVAESPDPAASRAIDAPTGGADHPWRASKGPAPWDDGWPREWFYAHPRDADDWRWARMAQHVGHPAPPLQALSDWRNGDAASLEDLRGGVVLLKFWATWCSDCARSVSTTAATAERLGGRVTVLEICARKGAEDYAASVEGWGIGELSALDATGASETAYDVPRWPFYVLIDSRGVVRASGLRTAHVDAALDHLLALEVAAAED